MLSTEVTDFFVGPISGRVLIATFASAIFYLSRQAFNVEFRSLIARPQYL